MNYEQKYLKYKAKYTELKKQIGQGRIKHPYITVVPEFANKTKPEFKNETPRNLNTIDINHNLDGRVNYEYLKSKILENERQIVMTDPETPTFLKLLKDDSNKIIEIEGFYNIYKNYVGEMNEGTYVKSEDFAKVFKEPVPENIRKVDGVEIKGFIAGIGAGKKNLNNTMKEYKTKGIQYVMLENAGGVGALSLYRSYGLKTILSGYMHYGNRATSHIMFSNIDDVIASTN